MNDGRIAADFKHPSATMQRYLHEWSISRRYSLLDEIVQRLPLYSAIRWLAQAEYEDHMDSDQAVYFIDALEKRYAGRVIEGDNTHFDPVVVAETRRAMTGGLEDKVVVGVYVRLAPLTEKHEEAAAKLRTFGEWWFVRTGLNTAGRWFLTSAKNQPRTVTNRKVEEIAILKSNDPSYRILQVVEGVFNYKKHHDETLS